MANESFSKGLPSTPGAPAFVDVWRRRALRAGLVFSILAVIWRSWVRGKTSWAGTT